VELYAVSSMHRSKFCSSFDLWYEHQWS